MSDVEDSGDGSNFGDMYNLLKEVLKNAQVNGSLLHGIHEGTKALEKKLGMYFIQIYFIAILSFDITFRFCAQGFCVFWQTTVRKVCTRN